MLDGRHGRSEVRSSFARCVATACIMACDSSHTVVGYAAKASGRVSVSSRFRGTVRFARLLSAPAAAADDDAGACSLILCWTGAGTT